MNKYLLKHTLLPLASCIITLSACNLQAQNKGLSVDEFQQELSRPSVQLLDVRTAGEYQNGHLANALQADWNNQEQFMDRIQYLDKSKPVLVYCASGVRSAKAADWMKANGFSSVQNMDGGIVAWKKENKPVEQPDNIKQLTIDEYTASITNAAKPIVLVDFGAEWCPPCKKMEPVITQLQNELKDQIVIIKVDAGINTNVMSDMKVASIPTFIVYKSGKETWRKQGVVDAGELRTQLK
ncbi:DUF953 domain-containing protein [Danxiaibacter flavus]|uniref:DUF953 domain-containing protein n=1 Tax=Danxiaibacter flavus TaxID=3049108 RepID=A0ABV3ZFD0_9BACT|nr:DUF953 domain-containing protein [Chitinophagaceae bacterium DXS]